MTGAAKGEFMRLTIICALVILSGSGCGGLAISLTPDAERMTRLEGRLDAIEKTKADSAAVVQALQQDRAAIAELQQKAAAKPAEKKDEPKK